MPLLLSHALRLKEFPCTAFVGSGGKTSAIFQAARELKIPVIVSASSHLGVWQIPFADSHLIVETESDLRNIPSDFTGILLVTGGIEGDRTRPLRADLLAKLHILCRERSLPLLIEADGSRGRPLKGWAEHEPPIPDFVNQVATVVGLSALGLPLTEENIHRPEIFSTLSGLQINQAITVDGVIQAITHSASGLKNIPAHARRVILLNQADTGELQGVARGMVNRLLGVYQSVVIASVKQSTVFAAHEPIAVVVLAAGEASRYGAPKQLLDWKGEPFIRTVVKQALMAEASRVVVAVGAYREQVEHAIAYLPVDVVQVPEWNVGQSRSVRAGVGALLDGGYVGGVIFLLVDQPQVTSEVLRALIEKHAEGLYPIVAPLVMDRRANPVLFDRAVFGNLLELEGDTGGRAVFREYEVEYLPWHDDRLLLDVDTPEQYQRLLDDDTL